MKNAGDLSNYAGTSRTQNAAYNKINLLYIY